MLALDGVAAPGLDPPLKDPPHDDKAGAQRLWPEPRCFISPQPPADVTQRQYHLRLSASRTEGNLIGVILTFDQVV